MAIKTQGTMLSMETSNFFSRTQQLEISCLISRFRVVWEQYAFLLD